MQFEKRQDDGCVALPFKKYNKAHETLISVSCKTCSLVAAAPKDLRRHENIHTGQRPYACQHCDLCFAEIGNLRRHEKRKHSPEKRCICSECGESFADSTPLRVHQRRRHSGEKPHACGECEMTFTTSAELRTHKRKHSEEKPFVCKECGKRFTQKQNMRAHQRRHINEKSYLCGVCGKGFNDPGDMRVHNRRCRNVKLYPCGQCDKRCVTSGDIRAHQQTHDRPTDFPCPYQEHSPEKYTGQGLQCETFFTSETSLGFHIREHHDKAHVFKMPAELAVREALKQTFGEAMQHDWQNYMSLGSCESIGNRSYRFDFRTPAPEGFRMLVITEVDEFQHRRYPCDLKRMLHAGQILMQEFPDTPLVFVRWNPDSRKIGAVHFNVPLKERVKMLMRALQNEAVLDGKKMSDLVSQGLNVIYMYYDLERPDGELDSRVCMLNGVTDANADNAATVRGRVIAAM